MRIGVGLSVPELATRGGKFSPASLFSGGTAGVWYDPSDYNTLFQDSAGTTPVTAVEQSVGLMLDKSKNQFYPRQFFPNLPIELNSSSTAIQAALVTNASISNAGIYYVKPSTGSDSNAGTIGAPFATVAKAMRTATGAASRVVMLEDCTIPPFDLRNTDASQTTQQFKWLDANGYNVIITVTGPALSSQTWTQDATYTNCWTTTLSIGASQSVTRVLQTNVLDAYGYQTPLRLYSTAALLNSATDAGYYWDNAGKVLWLNIGGNVESQKANYRALYLDTAGNSRIYVQGSALGLSGVRMEGVQIYTGDGGGRRPEIWMDSVTQLWAFDKGADVRGWYVATNSLVYASQSDGCNAFTTWASGKSLIQTVNCRYIYNGDRRTYAVNGTLQGISAHGGSYHASFYGQFIQNNGQGVADTCAASSTDYSWLVGCTVTGGAAGVNVANYEFGSAAASAARYAFVDSCISLSAPSAGDLVIAANGSVQKLQTTFASVSGGSFLLYGNHATQSTSGSRPVLRARYNILLSTETLATQSVTTLAASYKLSFSGAGSITLSGTATGTYNAGTNTITCTAGTLTLTVSGTVNQADLRLASTATSMPSYQRVTTATDYDTAGFLTYLAFDGTDDSFGTNSIDFTGTDKMFVCVGVTKLSDASIGMVAEISANSGGNNGAFGLRAPYNTATADYGFLSNGTAAVGATATSYPAPITNVTSGIGNISGPAATLRVNGTQVANVTSSQGTGNYGNYPLYIGRRGNSSLPLNGRIYSLIVAGKTLSASELSATESWVAAKTGVTL